MKRNNNLAAITQRVIIACCLILGVLHIILLGFTYQRRNASSRLDADRSVLEENLNQLREINQEELDAAQSELDSLKAENAILEESFPVLGAPFAIYHRIKDLADQNEIGLEGVNLLGTENIDTVSGQVLRKQYSIEASGSISACLNLIQSIEEAGLDTVTMESINLQPEDNICSFIVNTLGYAADGE
jgi:hypothetical protein